MTDILIAIPKNDEFNGITSAIFGEPLSGAPSERIPYSENAPKVDIYRRELNGFTVSIAKLNHQTNTFSGVLTSRLYSLERPKIAILAGTCLGREAKVPIGAVIVGDQIYDASEKRPTDRGDVAYVSRGAWASHEILNTVREFVDLLPDGELAEDYLELPQIKAQLAKMAHGRADKEAYIRENLRVHVESIASGNDYIMHALPKKGKPARQDLWDQFGVTKAYDMEASGFALASMTRNRPWLVLRTVSDHGNDIKRPMSRQDVSLGLGLFIKKLILDQGHSLVAQVDSADESLSIQNNIGLEGDWEGHMSYFDDAGQLTVFQEAIRFDKWDDTYRGLVHSHQLAIGTGQPGAAELTYNVSFTLSRLGYAAGTWSEREAHGRYLGALLGTFENSVLYGEWIGTHSEGIRKGRFSWRPKRVSADTLAFVTIDG